MERQLTHATHGHVLTNVNVWSRDSRWIVYDVRSDAAGSSFDGTRIERVHVDSGAIQVLYQSQRQACCGVATCSPTDGRVTFILGPEDPTPDWQYAPHHRRGVWVDPARPGVLGSIDARDVAPPFTPGALRGGTHVHIFSGDGLWLSFTYDDHVLATLETSDSSADRNQRNVAVAAPLGPVRVPKSHPRNHDGAFFCAVVTTTVNHPRPGSDEINRAYEDAWVGLGGYRRADGRWQRRALAFLGDLVDEHGAAFTELFIVDLPDDFTAAGKSPLEGTPTRRPAPPAGAAQRRLTYTAAPPHAGVAGPRHWPRSSPDGGQIAFLRRDSAGHVQLWTVSPLGGEPRQITHDPWGVASAFTWDPLGKRIAYHADGAVMTVDVETGKSARLTVNSGAGPLRPEACVFSPDGSRVAYVREVTGPGGRFNQVFVADSPAPPS